MVLQEACLRSREVRPSWRLYPPGASALQKHDDQGGSRPRHQPARDGRSSSRRAGATGVRAPPPARPNAIPSTAPPAGESVADVTLQIAVAASAANAPISTDTRRRETAVFTREWHDIMRTTPPAVRLEVPVCPSFPTSPPTSTRSSRASWARPLERLRIGNPFLVRTIQPAPDELAGRRVVSLDRMGKRIVFGFEPDLFVIVHLMIAGRFRWRDPGAPIPGKLGLAAFDFPSGTLLLTEAGSRRQASIHIVQGRDGSRRLRSGRARGARRGRGPVRRAADAAQPHAQACPHRSPHLQRHRQRLLGRDPARGAAVADEADRQPRRATRCRACSTPRAPP